MVKKHLTLVKQNASKTSFLIKNILGSIITILYCTVIKAECKEQNKSKQRKLIRGTLVNAVIMGKVTDYDIILSSSAFRTIFLCKIYVFKLLLPTLSRGKPNGLSSKFIDPSLDPQYLRKK